MKINQFFWFNYKRTKSLYEDNDRYSATQLNPTKVMLDCNWWMICVDKADVKATKCNKNCKNKIKIDIKCGTANEIKTMSAIQLKCLLYSYSYLCRHADVVLCIISWRLIRQCFDSCQFCQSILRRGVLLSRLQFH